MRIRKQNNKTLAIKATKNNCLSLAELKYFYPSKELITLWLREKKMDVSEDRNERKIRIEATLTKLECNQDYSVGLFTFTNKQNSNSFQLDIKYYGKLWWIFK